jgi:hypothetical protein
MKAYARAANAKLIDARGEAPKEIMLAKFGKPASAGKRVAKTISTM